MNKNVQPDRARKSNPKLRKRARQDADKQALREQILAAARKEFAIGSVETVSIQRIADTVGYSKGTVLKYFPTKIALQISVKEENLREIVERLERISASKKRPRERLHSISNGYTLRVTSRGAELEWQSHIIFGQEAPRSL